MESQELNNYIGGVSSFLTKTNKNNIDEECMKDVMNSILTELNISQANGQTAFDNLNLLTDHDSFSINTKYVKLKHDYENIALENKELKKAKENLINQFSAYKDNLKKSFSEQLYQKESVLKSELAELRQSKEKLQENYENQIQLMSASNAMLLDEKESNYTRQLVDSNNRIKHLQSRNRDLWFELNKLKQSSIHNSLPSEHEKRYISNQVYMESVSSPKKSEANDFEELNKFKMQEKEQLEKRKQIEDVDTFPLMPKKIYIPRGKPTVYRGRSKLFKNCTSPPLDPISNPDKNETAKTPKRKRKLYNPDDNDYLESFEEKR